MADYGVPPDPPYVNQGNAPAGAGT